MKNPLPNDTSSAETYPSAPPSQDIGFLGVSHVVNNYF